MKNVNATKLFVGFHFINTHKSIIDYFIFFVNQKSIQWCFIDLFKKNKNDDIKNLEKGLYILSILWMNIAMVRQFAITNKIIHENSQSNGWENSKFYLRCNS